MSPKKRGWRIAGWGLAGLFGLVALVVLSANVLLRTDLLRKLVNKKPESLMVSYQGASSWIPGHVSFDSLTLRSRDKNVEFQLTLQGVTLRFSLADLGRRRFHATRLRARKLEFRLRERLSREEATPARLARYPDIEGFDSPPLLPSTPVSPNSKGNPWRVAVDDLFVEGVEEIWIDSWNWTGKGSVAGAFELWPGREARVGPARLEVSEGELLRGTSKVAERTAGVVWCVIPRFDTRTYPGNDVWKVTSGGSSLSADLAGLAFLSDIGGPRMTGGSGSIRQRAKLNDGAGSALLSVTTRDVTLREGGSTLRGAARVDVRATDLDFPRGRASLAGTTVVLSGMTVDGAPAGPWEASISAPVARLVFKDGSLDARLNGTLSDPAPVIALLPSGLAKWVLGLLHLKSLQVKGHLEAGPSRLVLTSLRVSAGNFSLDGHYRSSHGQRHGEFRARKGLLSVRFKVPSGG